MRWGREVIRKVGSHCLGGAIHLHGQHASRVPGNRLTCTLAETWNHCTVLYVGREMMCTLDTHIHMQLLQRERAQSLEDAPNLNSSGLRVPVICHCQCVRKQNLALRTKSNIMVKHRHRRNVTSHHFLSLL